MPIDIILLTKGVRLDFYEYEMRSGLKRENFIGSASSLEEIVTNLQFHPKSSGGYLLAVANMGTESVVFAGAPDEIRYVNESSGVPDVGRTAYNSVEKSVLVPGMFAVIDLSKVPNVKNAVKVHFVQGKNIEIAWGIAAIYKNYSLLWSLAGLSIVFAVTLFVRKKA